MTLYLKNVYANKVILKWYQNIVNRSLLLLEPLFCSMPYILQKNYIYLKIIRSLLQANLLTKILKKIYYKRILEKMLSNLINKKNINDELLKLILNNKNFLLNESKNLLFNRYPNTLVPYVYYNENSIYIDFS